MKVNNRIRLRYDTAKDRYDRLAVEIRDTLKPIVESKDWFFRDRVKELESFALKIETGRFPEPATLEDFYACTVVVHRSTQIPDAYDIVCQHFDLQRRRPLDDRRTHMQSSSFQFDDLRMYVSRRSHPRGLDADLDGIVFEVQIKTVLQHAWSLATHDLIYKSDTVSWPKERIAYQVKAMLEHAEIAIASADDLAKTIGRHDDETENIGNVIQYAEQIWDGDALPANRRRFAQTVLDVFKAADVSIDQFDRLLRAEIARLGTVPINLSPYALIIQALAHDHDVKLKARLRRKGPLKVLIHQEMELPDWMWEEHERIINIDHA